MKKIVYLLVILSLLFSNALAQLEDQSWKEEESNTESWYTYWGLGIANVSYPSDLQTVIDYLKKQDGVDNMSLSLDLLGFYWHVAPQTIAGVIINSAGDRYTYNSESFQINQYIYGASIIHYPGAQFGSGFFLRADAGLAKIVVQDSDCNSTGSNSGFGFLAGGGWSVDFGGTRMLLNVNYAIRNVESEKYGVLAFSIGGLF